MEENLNPEGKSSQKAKEGKHVDTADFLRFLETVTPSATCLACGHDRFNVFSDPDGEPISAHFTMPAIASSGAHKTAPACGVYCLKCGWMRFHLLPKVWEWVQDNPRGEKEEEEGAGPEEEHDAQ